MILLVAVVGVGHAELGAHTVEEAHGVQGVLKRHDRTLGQPLLDTPHHLTQLVGVALSHDVEGLRPAVLPPLGYDQFAGVVDGTHALQEAQAAGHRGSAGSVGQQGGGELDLGGVAVAKAQGVLRIDAVVVDEARGADGLREAKRAERPQEWVHGQIQQCAPPSFRAHSLAVGEYGAGNPRSAVTQWMSPSSPEAAMSKARCIEGRNRLQTASMRKSLRLRATSMSSAASRALMVKAFSHST